MGRMLETLKMGPKPLAEQCVVDWTMRDPEDVPFIEVGSGKKVEGSSQVMSVRHPAQLPQPPHHQAAITAPAIAAPAIAAPAIAATTITAPTLVTTALLAEKAPPAPKAVPAPEPRPLGVVFEPWPTMLVPSRGVAPEIIAFHQPAHAISQQYGALLGKILEGQDGVGTKSVLLTGCKPSVGTTTALLNLAVVAATLDKRRLVVVDAHLMRPALAQRLGLAVPAGVQEILSGNAALENAVIKTPVAGMYLLASRGEDNGHIAHLRSEALAYMLGWLKDRFDLVLVDGPCMEEAGEIVTMAPLCDGMYLVVPQGDITPPHRAMAHNIGRHGGRVKGLIHTHFEEK